MFYYEVLFVFYRKGRKVWETNSHKIISPQNVDKQEKELFKLTR
jgi:hypothetical protein